MTSPAERMMEEIRQKPILLGVFLIFVTLLLYGQVASHEFLKFDDYQYVTNNPHVTSGLKWENIVWGFTKFYESNWHPLTWISHMVDCQLFALNPGPHHLINVLLHATNVLLLFLLLERATGAVGRSFFVAALFAVHPLNVETVAWVAQRKSLLTTLFSLLTVAAYGWYVRRPGWKRYLIVVAAFLLALMSKPMAVSLPFVLLLLDYWPLERNLNLPGRETWFRLAIEKVPLFLISVLSSWMTVAAQRSGTAMIEGARLPLNVRLGNAILSYASYLGKTFWPARLSVMYPHPYQSFSSAEAVAAAVVLVAITAAALYFHRVHYVAMGWFFFIVTLIPVIGIVQVGHQSMADRYMYIPGIGLFIIVAWGANALTEKLAIPRVIPAVAALAVIAAFAACTVRYLQDWQNGVSLFTRASGFLSRPDFIVEEALGDALVTAGRDREALQHFSQACALMPSSDGCHINMADILLRWGQPQMALEQYQLALSLTKDREVALACYVDSAQILVILGNFQSAEINLAGALQIDPKNGPALKLHQQILQQSSRSR